MTTPALFAARTIVVRETNWVGDVIMTTPALALLRRLNPDARIVALARPHLAPLLEHNPDVDEVWPLEDRGWTGWSQAVCRLRKIRFDWGLSFANSTRSALLLRAGGVRVVRAYAREARQWLLHEAVPMTSRLYSMHEVEYYIRLVSWARNPGVSQLPAGAQAWGVDSIRPGHPPMCMNVTADMRSAARDLLAKAGIGEHQPYLVVAPGAAFGTAKRWPEDRYAMATASLARSHGLAVVVSGGPKEGEITGQVCEVLRNRFPEIPVVNAAGIWSLMDCISVAAGARILLANDSGMMHVGAALGIPTLGIYGPMPWQNTAPWSDWGRVVHADAECAPCTLRHCPVDHRCMTRLETDMVVKAANALMAEAATAAAENTG